MNDHDARIVRTTTVIVIVLVMLRLVCAAVTPLAFDEAYYWLWSKHIVGGYYDHPPMVAVLIRLGTMVAGDTELGVRLVSTLLALPMSFAVYRAAQMLLGGHRVASTATLLLNATMIASVGTMIVTPDAPLMVASSFVLYALAKVASSGRGVWWLGVGVSVGLALLSKYNALFFGPIILIWLIAVPSQRRWLVSPWPYLGGVVAFAMFSPVILWNADHQWVSFIKQLGRARFEGLTLRHVGDVLPAQIAMATPFVFLLGAMGLEAFRRGVGALAARILIAAMVLLPTVYFLLHALHAKVEPNWLAPVYPAFALAAAVAATMGRWGERTRRVVSFCTRWSVPLSTVLFVAVAVQANTGLLSFYRPDPTVRLLGVGMPALTHDLEALRAREGAGCVLASDYGLTGWLAFYMPKGTCVAEIRDRFRWIDLPQPDPGALKGKLLFVDNPGSAYRATLVTRFNRVEKIADLTRKRGPRAVQTFQVDVLEGPKNGIFDMSPPIELQK